MDEVRPDAPFDSQARSGQARQDDDDLDRSMTVIAWLVIVIVGAAFVALWAASMHSAGTGRGLW